MKDYRKSISAEYLNYALKQSGMKELPTPEQTAEVKVLLSYLPAEKECAAEYEAYLEERD